MIEVGKMNRVVPALTRSGLGEAFNRVRPAYGRQTLNRINLGKQAGLPAGMPRPAPVQTPPRSAPERVAAPPAPSAPRAMKRPELLRPVQRGQKTPLGLMQGSRDALTVGFGWNVRDARCDIDASAFLLASNRRVPSDDWFVFYGQPQSPDGAVTFREAGGADREQITVDLGRLNPQIERIVFVLTINEAIEQRLNFGMIQEAWLRVLDGAGREMVSYCPTELYDNVTSMTLGELYLHSGQWRFNPVGNGVNTDLAGQCAVYGVAING